MEPLEVVQVIALALAAMVAISLCVAAAIKTYQAHRAEERAFLRNLVRTEISRAVNLPLGASTVAPHHHGDGRYPVTAYANTVAYNAVKPLRGTGIAPPHYHGAGRHPAHPSANPQSQSELSGND